MTKTDADNPDAIHWAQSLLAAEQRSLLQLLHDDLGQNLVAIRSFAAAIAEQPAGARGDSAELAAMIRAAADAAYRSSYDLMQELRAQENADREIAEALEICLREARLRENDIEYYCRVDPSLGSLDRETRALILRNLRCFVNFCKSLGACRQISVELRPGGADGDPQIALTMVQTGKYENLNREHPALAALAERIAAIGGEMQFETSAGRENFSLCLRFDPLPRAVGTQA